MKDLGLDQETEVLGLGLALVIKAKTFAKTLALGFALSFALKFQGQRKRKRTCKNKSL